MTTPNELPQKQCAECSTNIRRIANSTSYKIGVCFKCLKSNPKYHGLIKALNVARQQKYYSKHAASERARQKRNYRKSKSK